MMQTFRVAVVLTAVSATLAACAPLYPLPEVQFPTATAPAMPASGPTAWPAQVPLPATPAAATTGATGSLYRTAAYRPLFEDYRARLVGDAITVQIVERVSATQKATSTIDKKSTVNSTLSAAPLISPNAFARAGATGTGVNKFEGTGSTENTNDFAGTITAVVTGVLPNGHLLIAGEKQVGVGHNVDTLRFTGQVDPQAIQPGNTVQSSRVANVRVQHRGEGAASDAQGIGWLARFFLNLLPV
jgi:flagellar L-ring protein precursor FlgH